MKKVELGQTGLRVAPINLGGNVFGWTINEKQSFEILDTFVESGFNFIDTADTYSYWVEGNSGGESERIIGNWFKARGNRSKIVLATKVGFENGKRPADISKATILKTVEESLKRLNTDYIDLYYTHKDDDITRVDETMEAHHQLVKEGKVRAIGASNLSAEKLTASLEYAKQNNISSYQVYQPLYNLVERQEFETSYTSIIAENNLAVLPYYSLASGFLTGKYRSDQDLGKSQRGGGAKKYLTPQGFAVLDALDKISDKHNSSPAAISLAWLLTRPNVAAPIVSATSREQLQTILSATEITLDEEDINLLNDASRF
jgi:aryl-alcohol dehydrogenase-like predicted oxidoreductase